MKDRKRIWAKLPVMAMLMLSGLFLFKMGETKAADSYTNAKEFYESTGQNNDQHVEAYAGSLYYATKAKLASASGNLKYGTVGYDITFSGNGKTVSFGVKRNGNGSMQEVEGSRVEYGEYMYNLYSIPAEKLFAMAVNADASAAAAVLDSSVITVTIDAVMTTRQNGIQHGEVQEDGSGGLTESGSVYHLKNSSELYALKRIFTGHDFKSFYNIRVVLKNYELVIRYRLNGGTVGNGYSVGSDYLYLNGNPVTTRARLLQQMTLLRWDDIGLRKTGYHTVSGKEWMYEGLYFTQGKSYLPGDICPAAGDGSRGITLNANWTANTYTIRYDANGGAGSMSGSNMIYDTGAALKKNVFTRTGYTFSGWNTEADGSGISYEDMQQVQNLTTENNGVFTLYAQWEPLVFTVMTDKQGGSGGTDLFYEKYNTGWYSKKAGTGKISSITIPQRVGYCFLSYYEGQNGTGMQITDAVGRILVSAKTFLRNATIYAKWEPNTFTVTFDKQGGIGGTDQVTAAYQQELPAADAPVRNGWSFRGYYTGPDGEGEQYYNDVMTGMKKYTAEQDMILYAYWVDESGPEVVLTADISGWTNREITLTADACDYGTGLSSLRLYQADTAAAKLHDLNGAFRGQAAAVNPTEGAVNYRALAEDMCGNQTEAFRTVYYDITPPNGTVTSESYDGIYMELVVEQVNDIHVE